MQVTIDSNEPLDRVLRVINALYGVSLAEPISAPAASSRPTRRSRVARSAQTSTHRNKRSVDVSASAVREWARSNGHNVSDRGRVAKDLVEAYRSAN